VTFSGIIHESVLSSLEKMNLTIKDTTIPIHHFPESKKSEIKKKLYKKLGDIKLKTSDKKSSYEKAKRLLKEKNYKEAVPLLLSSLNDSTPSAYADCIYTYGKLQQPDKAREIFRKINGKNIFAYVQMGVVELNSGELQKALSLFTQVYTQDKRNVQAVVGLASVYYQLGNLKDSFVYIQKAIALVPNHPYAFELLAKINLHNKDIIHARKYFEISLKVLPENGEAWFNLGQIAVLQRDIKYALICFDNAMQHGDEKLKTMTRKRKEKIQQI